jgi:hypothetical protein
MKRTNKNLYNYEPIKNSVLDIKTSLTSWTNQTLCAIQKMLYILYILYILVKLFTTHN